MKCKMYNGGPPINKRTARIIHFAGLLVPSILIFYGLLVQRGLVDNSHYISNGIFFAIALPWIAVAIIQFVLNDRNAVDAGIRLVIYHLLAALYIVCVTGFTTPFVAVWVLLFLATYLYFLRLGLLLSLGSFIVTGVVDIVIHSHIPSILLTNAFSMSAVLLVGVIALAVSRVYEGDEAELSRSKAQEVLQRDRILTIVNNLADAILSTDKNGTVQVYNAASLNLLNTNSSLNGRHINEILTFNDKSNHAVDLYHFLQQSRGVVVRDDLTMTIDNETLRLEVTCSPIHNTYSQSKRADNTDGYILILRDITKAKSLEEERDEFISVVSHELRTPITIAEGTISNVQVMMERPEIASSVLKDAVKTAHDQVIFLARMVNDLSTLSRAERGVADAPEPIEVRALIDDLYNEYAPQAVAKKLHFDLDLDPGLGVVSASRLYLKELLQNFITNSLKYTKEGNITLKVTQKDHLVTFSVTDTGIGISKSDQTKIFNKFYRSEDYRTRETGGTGLGLYVAAKLAKKLDTKIQLQSRLNHGSTFSITLPIKQSTTDQS